MIPFQSSFAPDTEEFPPIVRSIGLSFEQMTCREGRGGKDLLQNATSWKAFPPRITISLADGPCLVSHALARGKPDASGYAAPIVPNRVGPTPRHIRALTLPAQQRYLVPPPRPPRLPPQVPVTRWGAGACRERPRPQGGPNRDANSSPRHYRASPAERAGPVASNTHLTGPGDQLGSATPSIAISPLHGTGTLFWPPSARFFKRV
jgi:hypothetical protein